MAPHASLWHFSLALNMSISPGNRAVFVDDTDPRIKYLGNWEPVANGETDGFGDFGVPFKNTLHRALSSGSFSFKFRGSRAGVAVTMDTTGNNSRPFWTCSIDGQGPGQHYALSGVQSNSLSLCDINVSGTDEHLLTFNLTLPETSAFWFDRVSFVPLDEVVEGETIFVEHTDPAITFEPTDNWRQDGNMTVATVPDSFLTFKFSGTSVTFLTVQFPNRIGGVGHYTIDSGDRNPFNIPSHSGDSVKFNTALFTVSGLSPNNHTLVVTFAGQNDSAPLGLHSFLVDLPSVSPTADIGETSNRPPQTGVSPSTPVGAIVGGVVGGVFGLLLLALIVWLLVRRRRLHPRERSLPGSVAPTMGQAQMPVVIPLPLRSNMGSDRTASSSDVTPSRSTAVLKQERALAQFEPPSHGDIYHSDSGIRYHGESSGRSVHESDGPREIPPQYTET